MLHVWIADPFKGSAVTPSISLWADIVDKQTKDNERTLIEQKWLYKYSRPFPNSKTTFLSHLSFLFQFPWFCTIMILQLSVENTFPFQWISPLTSNYLDIVIENHPKPRISASTNNAHGKTLIIVYQTIQKLSLLDVLITCCRFVRC